MSAPVGVLAFALLLVLFGVFVVLTGNARIKSIQRRAKWDDMDRKDGAR